MTEEQYQFKKTRIQERLRKEMIDLQQRMFQIHEQAANQLFDLEQEYRGMKPSLDWLVAYGVVNDCMKCRCVIPFGYAYCDKCQKEIAELESSDPFWGLNLLDKEAVTRWFKPED